MLADYAENIVNLQFRGSERVLSPVREVPTIDAFRGRLLRLEVIRFNHPWRAWGDAFAYAPRLHTLELERSADLLELKSRLPIAQIETIRFHASTSGFHLGSFPKLTSLVSIQTDESLPVRVPQTPPKLLALTTWRVELPTPNNRAPIQTISTDNFFARFRTPALRTLHVRRLASVQGVIQMLRTSGCELTMLVLEEPLITAAEDLLRLLAETPDLQSLEILSGFRTTHCSRRPLSGGTYQRKFPSLFDALPP